MASQQPQPRPWFRLASMARPAAPSPTPPRAPATQAQPPAPQPRPPFTRPAFVVPTPTPAPTPQPAQPPPPPPQEPTPPPPPPQVASASPPPTGRVSSVPTSPTTKSTAATTLPVITSSASLPSSPKPSIPPPPSPPKPIISVPSSSTLPISSPSKPVLPSSAPAPVPPAPISAPASVTTPAPPLSSVPTTAAPATTLIARLSAPSSPKMDVKPLAPEASPAPKFKPFTPAPPPLTLPPAQLKPDLIEQESKIPPEAEQKTVLVQESTIGKQFEMPSRTGRTTSIFNHQRDMVGDKQSSSAPGVGLNGKQVDFTKGKGSRKKLTNSDSEGFGARIITLAGDNKGAIMEFNPSQKKKASDNNSSTHKTGANSSAPLNAFINSNVQDVNNSIVFNSSLAHHDPGVHLSLSLSTIANKGSTGRGIHIKDRNNNGKPIKA